MKLVSGVLGLFALAACLGASSFAQTQVAPGPREIAPRSPAELDELLSWVALYPDPLLAELLPAATYPGDVVLANRYLAGGGDPEAVDQQGWDPSVAAMCRYPDVLSWMDDNLSWTIALGEAFVNQPVDVMSSIQRLRARAQALGNLQNMPEANVLTDDGIIEILPADPGSLYAPVYDSQVIYIHSSQGQAIAQRTPVKTGPWLNHDFDWPNRRIIVWSPEQPRPAGWWSYSASKRSSLGDVHPKPWHRSGHSKGPWGRPGPGHSSQQTATAGIDSGNNRSTVTVIGSKSGASGRPGFSSGSRASSGSAQQSGSTGARPLRGSSTGSAGSSASASTGTRSTPGPAPMPSK